jgi:CRISPR-associated protein Csb1
MWDSTGPRGGLGVKFPRALVSEIVGINAEKGVKTSSRIDPANIKTAAGPVYKMKDSWTLDEKLADKEKSRPVKIGDGKPSEINHGNVTPTIADGSYTIDHAEQVTVLSLATLRRLKFPLKATDRSKPEVDLAARVYLAALGLLGVVLMVETADDLRSRCLLHAVEPVRWELLGKPGEPPTVYSLESADALAITKAALAAATSEGLPFHTSEVVLQPVPGLLELVRKSIQLAVAEGGNE